MKTAVIVNSGSGRDKQIKEADPDYIKAEFDKFGLETDIFSVSGDQLSSSAKTAASNNYDAVVAAGGDGTINAVASELAGSSTPLGILPFGTFNHFAKDLKIPLVFDDAVKLIAEGKPRPIDIAEVNGKIFINNSSVGLYPKAVKLRDKYLESIGGRKWMAMIYASLIIFSRFPLYDVRIEVDEKEIFHTTPFVFIGNNEYKFDIFNLGIRETVEGGSLSLYTAHCTGRLGVLRIAIMGLLNRLHQDEDFSLHKAKEILLQTRKRRVDVALDGEVIKMIPPLSYKIRPGNLQVILPV